MKKDRDEVLCLRQKMFDGVAGLECINGLLFLR
jgi:hypothetical protein